VLVAERVVDGEVPAEEFDALVEEARVAFRAVGYTSRTEHLVIWTARPPLEPGKSIDWSDWTGSTDEEVPHALVRIVARHGQTRIQVEQRLGGIAGGIFGGIWGGAGGAGVATAIPVGIAAMNLAVLPVLAFAGGWVGATYLLCRGIFRGVARGKQRALERLADRLADECEAAIAG
jgi:hypothetical protein